MPRYLHNPVKNANTVEEYIKNKQPEGKQLDFKAVPWKDDLELAKDVAAFANHLGGDIVIGVNDKEDCANGWCPLKESDIVKTISKIQQGLITHLRPSSFAKFVETKDFPQPTKGQSFLVVSIPPSIDLVAVEDKQSDKIQYKFPIRNNRRNQCLTYEEIMTRISIVTRNIYLKLKNLVPELGSVKVHFSNPVLIEMKRSLYSMNSDDGYHGSLENYDESTVQVRMENPATYKNYTNSTDYKLNQVRIPNNGLIDIPFDFVKSIWSTININTEKQLLHIALDAKIISYNGGTWTIVYEH